MKKEKFYCPRCMRNLYASVVEHYNEFHGIDDKDDQVKILKMVR